MKLKRDLVIFDLEATGTWIEKDKIIEIALIKISPQGDKNTYKRHVNPGIPIPPVVIQLTGITDKMVEGAPKFQEIAAEVISFFGDADIAGFNVERYDLPLLEREVKEVGLTFSWGQRNIYDVQKIYHLNEQRDLTAAYQFYCGKSLQEAHSAMADTQAAYQILEEQLKRYGSGKEEIEALSIFQYKKPAEFYDSERKFRWWNGKLYMMFGKYARKITLQEVAKSDKGYLEWILSSDFSEEVKHLVSDALNGRFPIYNMPVQGELFNDVTEE